MRTLICLSLMWAGLVQAQSFIYTNDSLSPNTVTGYSVDGSGKLTMIPGSPFKTGGSASGVAPFGPGGGNLLMTYSASRIVTTTVGNYLYASNDTDGSISGFAVNPSTGVLTLIAGSPFKSFGACNSGYAMAISPDGKTLAAGSLCNGTVWPYAIGTNGALTPQNAGKLTGCKSNTGNSAAMKYSADGRYLYVADSACSTIEALAYNQAGATVAPIAGSPFTGKSTAGPPASLDVNCSGGQLFAMGTTSSYAGTADVFNIGATGALTETSAGPVSSVKKVDFGSGVLTPNDQFLVISGWNSAQFTVFSVGAGGALKEVNGSPFGFGDISPAQAVMSGDGKFVFFAEDTGDPGYTPGIGVLSLSSTGTLTQVTGSPFHNPGGNFFGGNNSLAPFPAKACQSAAPAVTTKPTAISMTAPAGAGETQLVPSVTITNSGTAPLSIDNIVASDSDHVAIDKVNNCRSLTFQPGASCTFDVYFRAPATPGVINATIDITSNAPKFSIPFTGTATRGVPLTPSVSIDYTTLTMYSTVGQQSAAQTATVNNTGLGDLNIANVAFSGSQTGFSKVNDTCLGQTIHAGNSCHLDFVYNPTNVGPSQTTITITDNATPPTQTITLYGGIKGPAVLISPTSSAVTFDAVVGTPTSVTFKLTNAGDTALTTSNIKLRDNGNGFALGDLTSCFSHALNAGGPGQFGESCSFPVIFNPPNANNGGLYANALAITISPGLSLNVTLSGVAVASPPPGVFPATGTVSRNSADAAVEPVDGGTGQYYEDELDFSLNGAMNFQFGRYYGSSLSSGGFKSAMGTNWMNNFEIAMSLNGASAQVMLFRGQIVNFSKGGGSWTQTATAPGAVYQFAEAGSGYRFMSPVTNLVYTFNSSGKLTAYTDRRGNTMTVTPGPNGPTSISDGHGRALTLTYTGGNLTQVQDQSGRTVTYAYSGGNLVSATNSAGKTTQYAYTTAGTATGLMTKKVFPAGNAPTTQTYGANGKVTAQADPNGNTLTIAYDGKGATTITGPLGEITAQANNTNGDLGQITDPAGRSTSITYDASGRRSSITDRGGNTTQLAYHAPTGNLASRTNEAGGTTAYAYTPQTYLGFTFYNVTGITYADGAQETIVYDANGNPTSRTLPDGTTPTYAYDSQNNLTASTDANQQTTAFTYNADGTMASKQDAVGNKWAFTYSAAGLPSKIADPNGGTTSMTFDAMNRPLTMTDAAGGTVSSQYDDNGQLVARTNQYGGVTKYGYSTAGLLTSATDPLGNTTSFSSDAEGRITSITDAAGGKIAKTYDATGRVTQLADNNGPRVNFTFDAESHVASQTDPTGRTIGFTYNARGELTATTKPDGSQYTFAYDKRDRLLSTTNPLGETQSAVRDVMGRVTQVNLPGGLSSSLQLDKLGRTTAITSPNGNTWTIGRDGLGRMTSYTDPLGNATTYSYTGTFLTGLTLPLGTVAITRNAVGRVTGRQYSDGTAVHATWDPMGLLTSADGVAIQRDTAGQPVNVNGLALTYTPAGRLASVAYASGKTVKYSYDAAGRLSSMSDWAGGQTSFTYDAAGRMTGVTYPNGVSNTYSFDASGRLAGIAVGSLASIALTRDADGKITAADRNLPAAPALQSASQQFSYNAGSQLTSETYDAMGRALTQNNRSYSWNLASQLTAFSDSSNTGTLTYDGLGELASSNINGVAKNYVFNHVTQYPALSVVQQGGADLRYYAYLPDGSVLYSIEAADNTRRFFHFDEMGNTAFLTGEDGSVTDTYAVTPYGDVADHSGTADNPFTWQGQYGIVQEAPGLYFLRARHYDASAGRFLSPDPLTTPDPRSAEPYIYARGNPLLFSDPSGRLTWADISDLQVSLRALDNDVPTPGELTLLFSHFLPGTFIPDPNALAIYGIVAAHPGLTWWQVHYLADDGALAAPLIPATNANGLAHCVQTKSCDPSAVLGLTKAVAAGMGAQVELSASALLSLGGKLISQDGAGIISQDGAGIISQDGAGIVSHDSGGLISQDGAGIISHDSGGLISQDGAGLVAAGGGNIVAAGGGNIVAAGGGN